VLNLALTAAFLGLSMEALALVAPQVAVATRTKQSPTIDGNLSDPVWAQAVPIIDFTQQTPDEGERIRLRHIGRLEFHVRLAERGS